MTTWHKGPPPSIGWWPASNCRDPDAHRYYNGEWWSTVAYPEFEANRAAAIACCKDACQDRIEWTDRPADWAREESHMKDGGPAFPVPDIDGSAVCEGMTLLDWFAGQALMGMMASRNPSSPRFNPEDDAAYVYAVADAMIQERSKT